jgi:hypothetical protein
MTYDDVTAVVLTPAWNNSDAGVAFTVEYVLLGHGVVVEETYSLAPATDSGSPVITVQAGIALASQGSPCVAGWLARLSGLALPRVKEGRRSPRRRLFVNDAREVSERAPALSVACKGMMSQESQTMTVSQFGVTFPVFSFDGATNTTLQTPQNSTLNGATNFTVAAPGWGGIVYAVPAPPLDHVYTWSYGGASEQSRNGMIGALKVAVTTETNDPTISYSISGQSGPAMQTLTSQV